MKRIFLVVLVIFAQSVLAADLKTRIQNMEPLSINYGANDFVINQKKIMITRGLFQSPAAWSGDGYSVFIKEDKHFQMVQFRDQKENDNKVITWAMPHTGEDALSAVRFFVSKDWKYLYMLQAHRAFKKSVEEEGVCTFVLYRLHLDDNFDIYYFNKIDSTTTARKYLDVIDAMQRELSIN